MEKVYIGDGAYMELLRDPVFGAYKVILTAENGVRVTDTVVLEQEVLDAMLSHLKKWNVIR